MCKLNIKLFLIFLLVIFNTLNIVSSPTIGGTTGLILMPTADSLNYKEFNLASDWLVYSGDNDNDIIWKYKANIGVFNGLEIGFVGQNNKEGVFINIKYYLLSDNTKNPIKVAIGIDNISSYDKTDTYMVASKRFNKKISGHFGFLVDIAGGEANSSLMLGAEYLIDDKFVAVADLKGEESKYIFNLGTRYFLNDNLLLSLFILNLADQDISVEYPETMLAFGISWTDFL